MTKQFDFVLVSNPKSGIDRKDRSKVRSRAAKTGWKHVYEREAVLQELLDLGNATDIPDPPKRQQTKVWQLPTANSAESGKTSLASKLVGTTRPSSELARRSNARASSQEDAELSPSHYELPGYSQELSVAQERPATNFSWNDGTVISHEEHAGGVDSGYTSRSNTPLEFADTLIDYKDVKDNWDWGLVTVQCRNQQPDFESFGLLSHLGQGRVDPFWQFPIDYEPFFPALFDFYDTYLTPAIPELDHGDHRFLRTWFFTGMTSKAQLYCQLSFAAAHLADHKSLLIRPMDVLSIKCSAISAVNELLKDPRTNTTEHAISAVLSLAGFEFAWGDLDTYMAHMDALKKMIAMRGGISQLHPVHGRVLAWVSTSTSCWEDVFWPKCRLHELQPTIDRYNRNRVARLSIQEAPHHNSTGGSS